MTMRTNHRTTLAALAGLAVVVAAAACQSTGVTASASTPTPTVTVTATVSPTATTPAPAPTATIACPVTADELLTALKAKADIYSAIASPPGVGGLVCVPGFAVARADDSGNGGERARILFGYDAGTRTWIVLTAGTAMDCGQYLSTDLARLLPGCASD
jgi:hypothetical protein